MNRTAVCLSAMIAGWCIGAPAEVAWSLNYPGKPPGPAAIVLHDHRIEFSNQILSGAWGFRHDRLRGMVVRDLQSGSAWESPGDLFRIVLADGTRYGSSSLQVVSRVAVEERTSRPNAPRIADQCAGRGCAVAMRSEDARLQVIWRAVMLDESNYVRQELELRASQEPLTVREVVWLDELIAGAASAGSVDGSLIVAGPLFMGCEDPMAENGLADPPEGAGPAGRVARCRLACNAQLHPGADAAELSFVMGVAPQNQLRRAFLYYLERERAHPYRPYLHYNSWYDTSWQPFALNEDNCLEAIRLFGQRLIRPHGVVMDGIVLDDGWDNPHTLWQFHGGFPRGFTPLTELCQAYGTRLGVWLSPFGGYGESREQRLAYGREQGFETNPSGFSLAGPRYYQAFREACVGMIRNYAVNYFKFDGIAQGTYAQGAGEYLRDTEAMRRLMQDLRREDPQLFINLTTGSWPSPFWLGYADSLWRQGGDMGLAGVGTNQQQWLTYRDQETYRNIVCRAPLYPLNALMTQGVAYSRQGPAGHPTFTSAGFRDDVRAFFGSGTNLQELYIQPGKLTDADWSALAEAAKWARANSDILVDTHWIGGDPSKLEVYGFASWAPRQGIVMLRNPDEHAHEFLLDVGAAWELPSGSATTYTLRSPWVDDAGKPELTAKAGTPLRLRLEPFEVVVLDATPLDER